EGDQHIVKNGDHSRGAINPFEAEGNIYQHAQQSIESCKHGLAAQLSADLGTDDIDVANGKGAQGVAVRECGSDVSIEAIDVLHFIKVGDDAAVFLVARVNDTLGELVVAVATGDAKGQRIFLGEIGTQSGGGNGIEVRLAARIAS